MTIGGMRGRMCATLGSHADTPSLCVRSKVIRWQASVAKFASQMPSTLWVCVYGAESVYRDSGAVSSLQPATTALS